VEAGSNTSSNTLRVVGVEKGSLKIEIVKYGREFQGTRTRERLRWREPAAYTKDKTVLSSQRAPHKNKTATGTQSEISGPEPQMGLDTKTYWLTDRQSQCNFDFDLVDREFCTGVCEEMTWALEAEKSPLLEATVRERLVKTLQAGENLACSDL
jgi:hypothetical protein